MSTEGGRVVTAGGRGYVIFCRSELTKSQEAYIVRIEVCSLFIKGIGMFYSFLRYLFEHFIKLFLNI